MEEKYSFKVIQSGQTKLARVVKSGGGVQRLIACSTRQLVAVERAQLRGIQQCHHT
jgi:hypothetical protein